MPQDPNSYLPQSALPIGQTPIDIRGANVPTNIPNPLDVTNFFRMQQGIQGNLQLIQGMEELKLRKQQMDLQTYESMVKDVDSIMNMGATMQGQLYSQHAASKEGQDPNDPFNGFNDNFAGHAAVKERLQTKLDDYNRRIQDIGIALIKSGSKDPGVRAEAIRGMQTLQGQMKQAIMNDPGYKKYKQAATSWDLFNEQVLNPPANLTKQLGSDVDWEQYAQIKKEYEDYINNPTGYPKDFNTDKLRVDNIFFNSGKALTDIATDAQTLQAGKKYVTADPDGRKIEHTVVPTRDETIDALVAKYQNDPNVMKTYKSTHGAAGVSFRDWIAANVNPYVPTTTNEIITDMGPVVPAPKTTATGQTFKPMFGDSAGAEPLNEIQMDIEESGFNPRIPDARMKISTIDNLRNLEDASLHPEVEYVQKDGSVQDTPDENTVSKRYVQRGTRVIEKEQRKPNGKLIKAAVMGDKIIAEFPKMKAPAAPTSSVDSGTLGQIDSLKFNPTEAAQKAGPTMSPEDKIAAAESSGGNYKAVNNAPEAVEGAVGKYQFLWNTHKNKIKEITGVTSKEDFLNNPDAQEKYFEYINQNVYVPAIEHIQSNPDFPSLGIDDDSLRYMLHYMGSEKAVTDFLKTGKFILYGKDRTQGALKAFELYSNKTNTDLIGSLKDHFAAEATTGGMHTITSGGGSSASNPFLD